MNVYEKLQQARFLLSKKELKKSGFNKFANFNYYELSDFLPSVNEIFAQLKLISVFNPFIDNNGIEHFKLTIYNSETPTEKIEFRVKREDAKLQNPIQNEGAINSYIKRYAYLNALEISENDVVDAQDNRDKNQAKTSPKTSVQQATEKQIEIIKNIYDKENIEKIKEYYNIKELVQLSIAQASQLIERKKNNNETN